MLSHPECQVLGSQKKFRLKAISAHLVHAHSFESFEELNACTSSKNMCYPELWGGQLMLLVLETAHNTASREKPLSVTKRHMLFIL